MTLELYMMSTPAASKQLIKQLQEKADRLCENTSFGCDLSDAFIDGQVDIDAICEAGGDSLSAEVARKMKKAKSSIAFLDWPELEDSPAHLSALTALLRHPDTIAIHEEGEEVTDPASLLRILKIKRYRDAGVIELKAAAAAK